MPGHQYEYQPLSNPTNIRLLHIVPGSLDIPVPTELVEVSIKQAGCYVALSYVWGQAEASHDIFIGSRSLAIQPNLFGALQRLRKQDILTVWADALSIN